MAATVDPSLNELHPSVKDRVHPEYAAAYQHQVGRLRADQVPYEVYTLDRPAYTYPTAKVAAAKVEVGSAKIYTVPVTEPAGEIRVEMYMPTPEAVAAGGLAAADGKVPILVDFHGGGFVIGTLTADEIWCRRTCQKLGIAVANVEYRLSPEYPHPTPATDCWDAVKWIIANAEKLNVDISRVAVSGRSAGGNLAAVVSLLARDDPAAVPHPIKLQVLIVPVIDGRHMPEEGSCEPGAVPYETYYTCEHAPMLPLQRLVWFYNLWLGTGDVRAERAADFRASPILADSHAGLAPATIHVAEIDPLHSEGKAYHEKLVAAGTPSTIRVYEGMGHTFSGWDGAVSTGRDFVDTVDEELRTAFAL